MKIKQSPSTPNESGAEQHANPTEVPIAMPESLEIPNASADLNSDTNEHFDTNEQRLEEQEALELTEDQLDEIAESDEELSYVETAGDNHEASGREEEMPRILLFVDVVWSTVKNHFSQFYETYLRRFIETFGETIDAWLRDRRRTNPIAGWMITVLVYGIPSLLALFFSLIFWIVVAPLFLAIAQLVLLLAGIEWVVRVIVKSWGVRGIVALALLAALPLGYVVWAYYLISMDVQKREQVQVTPETREGKISEIGLVYSREVSRDFFEKSKRILWWIKIVGKEKSYSCTWEVGYAGFEKKDRVNLIHLPEGGDYVDWTGYIIGLDGPQEGKVARAWVLDDDDLIDTIDENQYEP